MFVTSSMPAGPVRIPVYKRVAEFTKVDLLNLFAEPLRPHVQVLELDEAAGDFPFDPASTTDSARRMIQQEARGPMTGLIAVPAYVIIAPLDRSLGIGKVWAVVNDQIVVLESLKDDFPGDQYAASVVVAVHPAHP